MSLVTTQLSLVVVLLVLYKDADRQKYFFNISVDIHMELLWSIIGLLGTSNVGAWILEA